MADDNKQKPVETSSETTKPSTAKKAPAKKQATKKAPATPDTGASPAEATQKPIAQKPTAKKPAAKKSETTKKTVEPKEATKKKKESTKKTADKPKAETSPKTVAAKTTVKKKTETAKPAEKPKAKATKKAETAKPADKTADLKTFEAPEMRKPARGRVAKKVDDPTSIDSPSELSSPEAPATATVQPEAQQEVKEQVEEKEEKKESTPQELLDRGAAWLKELFVRMNLKASVETREQDTDLLFNVSVAKDSPACQNLSARTLESIQTLLADVLSERGIGRVVVDIDGFLQNRDTELAEIAAKLGKIARKVNGAITIAGFNSNERRVIHQSLESERDLKTESTDVGAFRKLRIFNQK